MRKFIKVAFICFMFAGMIAFQLNAQVVINNANPNPIADGSAVLELQSTDMGLLVPKVVINDLLSASPISSPAEGLLVYSDGGLIVDGFYWWNGTKWVELINDSRIFAYEQFGELYEIFDSVAGNPDPTLVELNNSTQWYGWKTAEEGFISTGMTADTTQAFADRMNITRYGLYKIDLSLSIGGTQNQVITTSVFVVRNAGGEEETRIQVFSKISSQGDSFSGSSVGVLELFPGDAIDLRFKSSSNGEDLFI